MLFTFSNKSFFGKGREEGNKVQRKDDHRFSPRELSTYNKRRNHIIRKTFIFIYVFIMEYHILIYKYLKSFPENFNDKFASCNERWSKWKRLNESTRCMHVVREIVLLYLLVVRFNLQEMSNI